MTLPWLPRLLIADRRGRELRPAQDNGITLLQLRALSVFVQRLCKAHKLKHTSKYSMQDGTFGHIISWTTVDMHDICQEIILKVIPQWNPCSWVEICAEKKQAAKRYVSHNWSEPFRDFMMGIDLFATQNDLSGRDDFFICTFAINQWNVRLGDTLTTSPFYYALFQADTLVLMLDKEGSALTRIWVVFEVKASLELTKEICIVTPLGLVTDSRRMVHSQVTEAIRKVDFGKAKASNPADRRQIMNHVAGVDEMAGIAMQDGFKILAEAQTGIDPITIEKSAMKAFSMRSSISSKSPSRAGSIRGSFTDRASTSSLSARASTSSIYSLSDPAASFLPPRRSSTSGRHGSGRSTLTDSSGLGSPIRTRSSFTIVSGAQSHSRPLSRRAPRLSTRDMIRQGQDGDYEADLVHTYKDKFKALNEFVRKHAVHEVSGESLGCDIDDPALRGVTLTQLRIMALEVKDYFATWFMDPDKEDWCVDEGVADISDIKLIHVINHYFKDILERNGRSSYMECISECEQPPEYLISFPFNMCMSDLIAAVEWHAEARKLHGNTTYWIAICAMSDVEVFGWIDTHKTSPIFCAMDYCEGLVVIMDEQASVLDRALPSMEIHEVLSRRKPIDLACLSGVLATSCPFDDGSWEFGTFASGIAEHILKYEVRNIAGKKVEDCDHAEMAKCKIARLAYQDGAQAPIDCDAYDEFNQRLRSKAFGPILRSLAGTKHAGGSLLAMRLQDLQDSVAHIPLTHSSMRGQLGERALHITAAVGDLGSIQALLDENAAPDAKDAFGETPLHYAAFTGNAAAARLLLSAGASAHIESHSMQTAADVAKENPCAFLGVDTKEVGKILLGSLKTARSYRRASTQTRHDSWTWFCCRRRQRPRQSKSGDDKVLPAGDAKALETVEDVSAGEVKKVRLAESGMFLPEELETVEETHPGEVRAFEANASGTLHTDVNSAGDYELHSEASETSHIDVNSAGDDELQETDTVLV